MKNGLFTIRSCEKDDGASEMSLHNRHQKRIFIKRRLCWVFSGIPKVCIVYFELLPRNQTINPNESKVRMIRINFDWKFGLDQSKLELILIEKVVSIWFRIHSDCCLGLNGLGRIDFSPFFIKRVTKRFSD